MAPDLIMNEEEIGRTEKSESSATNSPKVSFLSNRYSLLIAALIFSSIIALLFFFLQFKEFELYWCAVFFLRCVHTFFDDFDLSKRDKQVTPSGALCFIRGPKWALVVLQLLIVVQLLGWP